MIEVQLMGIALATPEIPQSISEHFDIIYILLIAAIAIITRTAVRAFNKVCERVDEHETRLSNLEGEHREAMRLKVHE